MIIFTLNDWVNVGVVVLGIVAFLTMVWLLAPTSRDDEEETEIPQAVRDYYTQVRQSGIVHYYPRMEQEEQDR